MSSQTQGSPISHAHDADRSTLVRELAGRTWTELQQRGILPTPPNFELWYTHLGGGNPWLSTRLACLLDAGTTPSPQQLSELHAECLVQDIDVEAVADSSEQIDRPHPETSDRTEGLVGCKV